MTDLNGEAELLLQEKLETPEGTSIVCRYAAAYVRDLNREEYHSRNDSLHKVSVILDAASKHLRSEKNGPTTTPEATQENRELPAEAQLRAVSMGCSVGSRPPCELCKEKEDG